MKILNINFFNFRNLENTFLNLSEKINVFYGKNAQGKTSILEAIYFNSTGISFRTKKTIELIKYNMDKVVSSIKYEDSITDNNIAVKYEKNFAAKKEFFFNKKRIVQTDFYGKINIIAYIPEDIALINGLPKVRRDFFDMEISQIDKEYLGLLKKYNKLLKIINKYLKEKKVLKKEFEIYQEEYIKAASKIIFLRANYIKNLSIILNLTYRNLFNSKQELKIKYDANGILEANSKIILENIEGKIRKEIEKKREKELKYGFSLVGPHKDNYEFILNNYSAKINASQGEKKSIIFSLKLSEIELIKKNKKELPIIIIDDITSYFDESRRNSILQFLYKNNVQVIISSVEKLDIKAKNFYVEKGIIYDK
ncbi:MAG: DNA replication and repair protein RecF [Fusobacteriales bacterium]|nr:MAG: DNA replication and repair protein RecF [Fusobacteriales bacterium]